MSRKCKHLNMVLCKKMCSTRPGNGLFVGRMRGAKIEDNYYQSNRKKLGDPLFAKFHEYKKVFFPTNCFFLTHFSSSGEKHFLNSES